jgi:small-conductance mechanosensitive channel
MTREVILRWLIGAAVSVGAGLAGWLVGRLVVGRIARLFRRTPTDLDDALLHAASPHLPFWFLTLGVVLAVRYAQADPAAVVWVDKAALAALVFSLTLAISSFLTRVIASRAGRWPGELPATTLTQNMVRIVVVGMGLLVILGNLGIAIAPVLTALGVGSLAVALALQPTLSNLFAGLSISLARRIRVGDFVEIETGEKGYVTDVGWRSTQIRELPNNLVIVPNSRLAGVIVRNYSLPEGEQATLVEMGVAYGSDLAEVERVTVEAAREIQRSVPGAVEGFEPFVRFHTFADSSINFTVILRGKEFVDRYLVKHEFIKVIHRRYAEAGIQIPFPQRVVHLAEEGRETMTDRLTRAPQAHQD